MSAGTQTRTQPPVQVPVVRLFIFVGLIIAALAALDITLEKTEIREVHSSAQSAYQSGENLLKSGKVNEAVESLRRAHSLERENTTYQLGLIAALMTAHKAAEAAPLLRDLLQVSPNDSQANLLAARLMNTQGKRVEAAAYYHRAIYGEWSSDAIHRRIAVRRELIEFYRAGRQQQEMLAELIPLQEEVGNDAGLQKEVAHLYLQAGSPGHAAAVYTDLIKQNPRDAEPYAGRGQAELEAGDYGLAHNDFSAASTRDPHNSELEAKLRLLRDLTSVDPTLRRLTSSEKYRRSKQILQMARKSLENCLAHSSTALTGDMASRFREADKLIPAKTPRSISNELSEQVLDVAQGLWNARIKICGPLQPSSGDEETLRLIMTKLRQ